MFIYRMNNVFHKIIKSFVCFGFLVEKYLNLTKKFKYFFGTLKKHPRKKFKNSAKNVKCKRYVLTASILTWLLNFQLSFYIRSPLDS